MDQISLLENDNHAVNVSLADGRRLKVWTPFSELVQRLDASFLRINRGIVVNMDYIVHMETDICTLRDGSRLLALLLRWNVKRDRKQKGERTWRRTR